ncbi:MAG: hypothetical protein U0559_00265 [Anaerolineae bacterium]
MQPVVYDGELAMVTGFYDLTTRRQVEQAMRDSEERFRQLAENIREVFWMSSPALTGCYTSARRRHVGAHLRVCTLIPVHLPMLFIPTIRR